MVDIKRQSIQLPKDLGNGLILRRATIGDSDQLSVFNARIHMDEETKEPDQRVAWWTSDLTNRPHPTSNAADFTLVEDQNSGQIVSTLVLISQTWSYGGIDFKVGRPELVGTDPEYREKGLVRVQMEAVHQWSAERGELVQGITGIPYYYRQFGYEMGLELGGGRTGFIQQIPVLKGDEPYKIRLAEETDIPLLMALDAQSNQRYLVSCTRDEEIWRYELFGRSPQNVNRSVIRMITSQEGETLGFISHPPFRWGKKMAATGYEIKKGISWASVTPTVMRYLKSVGEEYSTEHGDESSLETFAFWLGSQHPVYEVIPDKLPQSKEPYAWYLRVPDLPRFLHHIRSQVEARLAASTLSGHSGEVTLTFYRYGLRMVIENGRLVGIEDWKPEPRRDSGDAGFPGLTFLQIVFGYRSLAELKFAFADCWTKDNQTAVLLDILFPKMASRVWPLS